MSFKENLASLQKRIANAGGDLEKITIVGVAKKQPVESIVEALQSGLLDIGENYAQELISKHEQLSAEDQKTIRWHFLGQLQSNKVKALAPIVHLWQSVDRRSIVDALAKHAPGARVLIQVNLSEEPQKGGCSWQEVRDLVAAAREQGLAVQGLMGVGSAGDLEKTRAEFRRLAQLAADLKVSELSIGMSEDLEVAIEEGATIVRVGTALFGPRPHAAQY